MSSRAALKAARMAKMQEMKATREGGKREYTAQEEDDVKIYDDVEDANYKAIVKGRLQEDFIEDDDGSGYADNGMDDWDRPEEPEEKEIKKSKKLKSAPVKKPVPKPVIAPHINPYIKPIAVGDEDDFMASLLGGLDDNAKIQPTTPFAAKPSAYAIGKKRKVEEEAALREAERARTGFRTNSSKSSFSSSSSSSLQNGAGSQTFSSDTSASKRTKMEMEDFTLEDFAMSDATLAEIALEGSDRTPAVAEEDDDDVFVKPSAASTSKAKPQVRRQLFNASNKPIIKPEPIQAKVASPPPSPVNLVGQPAAKPKGMDWRLATTGLALASTSELEEAIEVVEEIDSTEADAFKAPFAVKSRGKKGKEIIPPKIHANCFELDGSLQFWWYDVQEKDGIVHLVGKVKEKDGKKGWVSGMLNITGILRKLYILPRETMLDDEGNPLDDEEDGDGTPTVDDVVVDFELAAENATKGTFNFENKPDWVEMQYAFGIKGIPREKSNWVEVSYPYPGPNPQDPLLNLVLPMDLSGGTFSHVFGTNTSAFERFVLERKVMGPCWLNVTKSTLSDKNISHCKFEANVDVSNVSIFEQDDPTAPKSVPPLTMMSLSTRTVYHRDNHREVLVASARIYTDAYLDDSKPINEQASSLITLIRPTLGTYPTGFEEAARKSKAKSKSNSILVLKDEKALLDQLLNIISRNDPDVIIGINFLETELEILLKRMKTLGCENWSKLSRFQQKLGRNGKPTWPTLSKFNNPKMISGRLICDLSSDGSKSIIVSNTWSLTEMCGSHLKIEREDIDPEDTGLYFDPAHSTPEKLLHFVAHCEADCYFQMAIAHKVQALLLTRQLTNLAGNSWNRTLAGNRAERNEFILLHKFTEKGFVCPDKVGMKEKKAADDKAAKSRAKAAKEGGVEVVAKKETFKGGLVFEPKKGLCDRFVLVMDFNSLYPSIIQEYDIDFTTMDWTADDAEDLEKMPERAPVDGEPQGILPQLIFFLVDRRRNVKKLMKDKSATPARLLQYEITQKALKLTANSMYGCLGYEGSRFYARPLAALTTFKGREILTRTKADAEALDLEVIYGDTDSVMINTNVTEYAEAIKIGNEFKKVINDKYKKLEIDTDAVFERMLLLSKKKYAAVKIEEDGTKELEIKGLDMKRREYCDLSKGASKFVLNQILSGADTETVLEEVHNFLTKLGENIRAGEIPLEEFIIFKRLSKNPEEYPDAKSQAHVTVALRMKAKGQIANSGDVIPYIFCMGADGISQKNGKADRAYHPDEIRKLDSGLKIDYDAYLSIQVLPPIERLCEKIEGTERARLAECLGLDPSRYKSTVIAVDDEKEYTTLQSQIPDSVRFADAKSFTIRCRHCSAGMIFDGLLENAAGILTPSGLSCSNSDCGQSLVTASVSIQLELQIRGFINKFYETWLICNEQTCNHRTRMMSVYGKRCLVEGCRGQMRPEYTDSELYNQLLFFDSLFDAEKAKTKVIGTSRSDEIKALASQNEAALNQLRAVVGKHLDKNGRRWVGMATLFSFMV